MPVLRRWVGVVIPAGCFDHKAGKGIKITAADTFDFSALHYTDKDLFEIKYGHALPV